MLAQYGAMFHTKIFINYLASIQMKFQTKMVDSGLVGGHRI